MTYRISGLDPQLFKGVYGASEATLAGQGAVRMKVDAQPGYPCRVSLVDAAVGESVLLLPHRLERSGPYAFTYAIFVRENAADAATYVDEVPPVFTSRQLSLRGFDKHDMVAATALAQPGRADAALREILEDPAISYIDVHNAIPGCFAARVERA